MSNQIEYQPEGMRRAAAQLDAQVEPQMAQAEARVTDAAGHQSEQKWGTEDLGKPIVFGRMYAERLTKLEDEIHELSSAVGEFAQKVKLAASRADATEEEIMEIFSSQGSDPENHEQAKAQSSAQTGASPAVGVWES